VSNAHPITELRLAEGRAQAERIAEYFGWELNGYGFSREGATFFDLHDARHQDPTEAMATPHAVPGATMRAILRSILSKEAALVEAGSTRREADDRAVAYYFDADASKHERCVAGHPWAGWIIVSGKRMTRF
jgi:hypothetical protein